MGQEFECAYKNAQNERKKSERLRIEKNGGTPRKKFGLLKKVFLSKKYNDSLVRKLSAGELTDCTVKAELIEQSKVVFQTSSLILL